LRLSSRDDSAKLELGLGSRGRMRIIAALAAQPETLFTKYSIQKATRLKASDVRRDLEVLVSISWLKRFPFKPEKYQLNRENEQVRRVIQLLGDLKYRSLGPS